MWNWSEREGVAVGSEWLLLWYGLTQTGTRSKFMSEESALDLYTPQHVMINEGRRSLSNLLQPKVQLCL